MTTEEVPALSDEGDPVHVNAMFAVMLCMAAQKSGYSLKQLQRAVSAVWKVMADGR